MAHRRLRSGGDGDAHERACGTGSEASRAVNPLGSLPL